MKWEHIRGRHYSYSSPLLIAMEFQEKKRKAKLGDAIILIHLLISIELEKKKRKKLNWFQFETIIQLHQLSSSPVQSTAVNLSITFSIFVLAISYHRE